ncbi:SRPBCC family protein [Actinokineospora diospyrosa]|uniref:Polyketide cyclase / dehydrase and lipid transport n=1 Tax=Actinokineospora diospyrosa TaxID=103728 RepID=A0ABT1IAF2_9PSEU|nr:SRPBCC family protein [Actinokineospora diospyrosa]MCP2269609.1 Polyketide cyclase / dehydrase and lipid transport [Actinokineospora diospyrosa]
MVVEVLRSAQVPASIDRVWDIVSDAERAPDWFSFAERTEVLAGEGLGQRRRQFGRWGRFRSEIDQRVVAFEPPRVIAWEHTKERIDGKDSPTYAKATRFQIELAADGEHTTVRLRTVQEPDNLVRGVLMRLVGTKEIKRRMDESLARLARAVVSE